MIKKKVSEILQPVGIFFPSISLSSVLPYPLRDKLVKSKFRKTYDQPGVQILGKIVKSVKFYMKETFL